MALQDIKPCIFNIDLKIMDVTSGLFTTSLRNRYVEKSVTIDSETSK